MTGTKSFFKAHGTLDVTLCDQSLRISHESSKYLQ